MQVLIMPMRIVALAMTVSTFVYTTKVFAQEDPCAAPEPFQGYWGGGQVQVREHLMGIPILIATRFSYRQIRYSPCAGGAPVLPPGVGDASITLGIPLIDNRRAGWLLQVAAHGQGSQRANEPVSGLVTGAPTTSGHLNLWETPLPLIQLTAAASAAIVPRSLDVPLSVAYLGGLRIYPVYRTHTQANLGIMFGGSNGGLNIVPSFAFRISDVVIWSKRIAIGSEIRSPITLDAGPIPVQWRLWGVLTLAIERLDDEKSTHVTTTSPQSLKYDIIRSAPESAPPVQTAWETTL